MDKIIWTPIKIRLGDIIDWERNPKISTRKTADRLIDSLDTLGDFQTLAVSPFIDGGKKVYNYDGHSRRASWTKKYGADFEVHALQSSRMLTEREREKLAIVGHVATGSMDWNELAGWNVPDLIDWGLDEDLKKMLDNDANNLKELLAAEEMPNFEPIGEDEQPRLDQKKPVKCPSCGMEFVVK